MIDDFAGVRTVIKQPGLQQQLFCVKSDALIRAGIIEVSTDGVRIPPGDSELKIVAWNSLVDGNRAGILRGSQPEETHLLGWCIHIAHTICLQPRWSGEVIGLAKRA